MDSFFPVLGMSWQLWLSLIGGWLIWNFLFAWLMYLLLATGTQMTDARAIRWGHTIAALLYLIWLYLFPWPFGGLGSYFTFWGPGSGLNLGALVDYGVVLFLTAIWLIVFVWILRNPER